MQTITHTFTHHSRHVFDLNVRLCETQEGLHAWSPTQEAVLTLTGSGSIIASVDEDLLWNFRIGEVRQRIDMADMTRLMQSTTGFTESETHFNRDTGSTHSAVEIVRTELDGNSWFIAADVTAGTMTTYVLSETGYWAARHTLHADADTDIANVAAMATVDIGETAFVIVASASDNAVTVFNLTEGGVLTNVAALTAADGLPVNTPTDLQVVEGGGGTFVILASAGTSSVTALALSGQGGLTFADQVIDSRDTRFDATVAMDWITREGRIFGVVAGADGGFSILELLPSGRFIVHANVEDTESVGLTGINDVLLRTTATGLDVTAISASEESLTRFAIAVSGGIVALSGTMATGTAADELVIGTAGNEVLRGNGGADVLVDGAGTDTLYGGSGTDMFVLDKDGAIDRILDFNLSEDRLDLSAWGRLYDVDQLDVRARTDGALISFGDEQLYIVTHNSQRMTAADLTAAMILNAQHVAVWQPLVAGPQGDLGVDIAGTAGADVLEGGTGEDTIHGLGGDDIIFVTEGGDIIDGGAGRDMLTAENAYAGVTLHLTGDVVGVEDLRGSGFPDQLNGDAYSNMLEGGAGDDTLRAGDGDDTLIGGTGNDVLNGGAGIDTVSYADTTNSLRADLTGETANTGAAGGDTFHFIENLVGGAGNDTLVGDDADNVLLGGGGDDVLVGGNGADEIRGGAGADTLIGGAGDDILSGGSGNDLIVVGDADPADLALYL